MNETTGKPHKALLVLLRAGLWNREIETPGNFPLTAGEWEGVFRLARQQTVTGIVFAGLQQLPDNLLPDEPLLARWAAEVHAIERRNQAMDKAFAELYGLFLSWGMNPILQKGQGVALFYENPLLRECGDIDLYFSSPREQRIAATCIRLSQIQVNKRPDKSLSYRWKGIEVEHHTQLLDLHDPFRKDFAYGLERAKGCHIIPSFRGSGLPVTVPSPFMNLLLLDLHILKHATGWGIGLRQLCDMARACYKLRGETSQTEMEDVCRKLGLDRWNPLLHTFLNKVLGLPARCLPYPEMAPSAKPLLDIVWRSGNFGQLAKGRTSSAPSAWQSKIRTAHAFGHNLRFAMHYAPRETFWGFARLFLGQFK